MTPLEKAKLLVVALDHARLGLHVFPVARDKSTRTPHGWKDASVDLDKIRGWWAAMPAANVGFYPGASDTAVLDIDYGLTDWASFILWRDRNGIPPTYTVRSGSRPEFKLHLYFRGAIRDCSWELDGCSGQIKSLNGYVLTAHSEALHGEKHDKPGAPYEVIDGVLGVFAPTPDIVRNLRKPAAVTSSNSQVRKTAWNLPVHAGADRTGFLMEQTGAMRNLGCGQAAILARMIELNEDPLAIADPVDHDRLEQTAANCAKYSVPPTPPTATIGSSASPPEEAVQPEQKRPVYPDRVWEGTAAWEFAQICGYDSNIPLKMYIEAFRTILGAVTGDRIHCGVEGAIPRAFTFLISPFGHGKGSVIRRAQTFFNREWSNPLGASVTPGLLSGQPDFMWKPRGIGARVGYASSVPGMVGLTLDRKNTPPEKSWGDTIPRIISIHEELKTLLSVFAIEGTGAGLDGVICSLWDSPEFYGGAVRAQGAVYGEMLFSMLCAVTPEDWTNLFSKSDAMGGGLSSRLNIIGTLGEWELVGKMKADPDLSQLREKFFPRIRALVDTKYEIVTTPAADSIIVDWFKGLPRGSARMNIHAWRSAMLLSWLKDEQAISEKTAEAAVLLGQYQVESHEFYKTLKTDNPLAAIQAKIQHMLETRGPMKKGRLMDYTHAKRVGTEVWNRALQGLLREGQVGKREDGTYYRAAEK